MLLILLMLLDVAVAVENSSRSIRDKSVASVTEILTQTDSSVGASNLNSDVTVANNGISTPIESADIMPRIVTHTESSVAGSNSNSDVTVENNGSSTPVESDVFLPGLVTQTESNAAGFNSNSDVAVEKENNDHSTPVEGVKYQSGMVTQTESSVGGLNSNSDMEVENNGRSTSIQSVEIVPEMVTQTESSVGDSSSNSEVAAKNNEIITPVESNEFVSRMVTRMKSSVGVSSSIPDKKMEDDGSSTPVDSVKSTPRMFTRTESSVRVSNYNTGVLVETYGSSTPVDSVNFVAGKFAQTESSVIGFNSNSDVAAENDGKSTPIQSEEFMSEIITQTKSSVRVSNSNSDEKIEENGSSTPIERTKILDGMLTQTESNVLGFNTNTNVQIENKDEITTVESVEFVSEMYTQTESSAFDFNSNSDVQIENNGKSTPVEGVELVSEIYTQTETNFEGSNSNSDEELENSGSSTTVMESVSDMFHQTKSSIEGSNSQTDEPHLKPYFDNSMENNVTVQLGQTAYLHCRVLQLGDKKVAWVRPALHFLTIGNERYTGDSRFSPIHRENSDVWTLEIKSTVRKDAGLYKCQISTDHEAYFLIELNIVVPKATILEGSNLYIQSDTHVTLTCVIGGSISPPNYVLWLHNQNIANYDLNKEISFTKQSSVSTIRLQILNAQPIDSGNYTCEPSNSEPATITLHVSQIYTQTETNVEGSNSSSDVELENKGISTPVVESVSDMFHQTESSVLDTNSHSDEAHLKPYFDNSMQNNVTVQLGQTAYLHCRVLQLGDKTVAWVRPDLHFLTIGNERYTDDSRFSPIHRENSDVWTLEIKSTVQNDAGLYKCQISTNHEVHFTIELNVVVPKATILEGSNLYIQSDRHITLTCVISGSISPPTYVLWLQNGNILNYDSNKEIRFSREPDSVTVSRLQIFNAQPIDSGNYTCEPSNIEPASITLHVLKGRRPLVITAKPVAMTQDGQPSLAFQSMPSPFLFLLLLVLRLLQR